MPPPSPSSPLPLPAPPRSRGRRRTVPPSLMCPIRVWRTVTPPPVLPVVPGPPFPLVRAACLPISLGPPFPIRTEGVRRGRSASPPPSSPSLFAPPGTRGTPPPGPSLPPLAAPPRMRGEREGTPPPVPPFPIRTPPPASLSPWLGRPIRAGRGACEVPPPAPPFPHSRGSCTWGAREGICAEGGARGYAAPVRTGRGARGQAVPASPRVAQQGRRGLRAPAFTAPPPRFRAP
ncbi:hypothetical protein EDB84DRAFT_1561306 [Lactarius hengduanensis]|nr:hypothetical protein EDB84DRAFT_1561306 [Lactarius hengduanensis]